jgi:hypothetical protein
MSTVRSNRSALLDDDRPTEPRMVRLIGCEGARLANWDTRLDKRLWGETTINKRWFGGC